VKCEATSKRSGHRCRKDAMIGRTVCHMHGGKTPRGFALPQTRTGRYSQHLPARLAARYAEAQGDSELLALRDEVCLIDARLTDVLGRVDTGEAGRHWAALQHTWTDLTTAKAAGDVHQVSGLLTRIGELIQAGAADYAAWAEIIGLLQERRKLVESERKRLVELGQMITAERVITLVGVVEDAVRRHLPAHVDEAHARTILAAIAAELGAAISGSPGARLVLGPGDHEP
jgi:hypothetical protein